MTDMSGSSTSSTGGDGSGSTGGGGGGGAGGPCGACKFLRRKCISGCIFAPYFNSEQGVVQFAAVHKVFGASNVSKLLLHIPAHKRLDAVITICYEAQARLRDPVYGCVAQIFALQQQIVNLQAELSYLQATLEQLTPQPPRPRTPPLLMSPPFSIAELSSLNLPANIDLSAPFGPLVQPEWSIHQHLMPNGSGSGDLQALARELIDQHRLADTSDQSRPLPK